MGSTRARKYKHKYRSNLEAKVAALLPNAGYETTKFKYTVPSSVHAYCPDFQLSPTVFIEVKGRLMPSERKKAILVREANPDIQVHFFFDKSDNKIYKGSKTTYASWCDDNGFLWTDLRKGVPESWLKETTVKVTSFPKPARKTK